MVEVVCPGESKPVVVQQVAAGLAGSGDGRQGWAAITRWRLVTQLGFARDLSSCVTTNMPPWLLPKAPIQLDSRLWKTPQPERDYP